MDLCERKFSINETSKASGAPLAGIQNWLKRGLIVGVRDGDIEGGGTRGANRHFSFHALMSIAVARGLVTAGAGDLKKAFEVATRFSHSGHGPAQGFDDAISDDDPGRHPGLPYHHGHGKTWLIVSGENSRIVLSTDGAIRPDAAFPPQQRGSGYVVLNLSELFAQVCARLDLGDHRVILDHEYSAG